MDNREKPSPDAARIDPDDPPTTPDALHALLAGALGVHVPRRAMIEGHAPPFDYVCHAFFEGRAGKPDGPADCVVWASRGGGKTFLGALATALDLIYKPGIEVRTLGGSLEQSKRMYAHLRRIFENPRHPDLRALVRGTISERRLRLRNGSGVEVLAQSQASVRGTRVQKLRCDEVDLFDPEVWEAAQLTTRSARCGSFDVRGSVECLSTMHVPFGVMHRLVEEARGGARALFRWGVADVLAACGPEHACGAAPDGAAPIALPVLGAPGPCALWEECRGRAKHAGREPGHVEVRDAKIAKGRVPRAVWESEMLCRVPRRGDAVLPEFDPTAHVFDGAPPPGGTMAAGMDFGIRSPAVVLFARVDESGLVHVVDERVEAGLVLDSHVQAILGGLARDGVPAWPVPAWIGIDPAGLARSEQTGISAAGVLRRAGLRIRAARHPLLRGIALLRAMLAPASGAPTLFVHRRCRRLLESMARYRYPPDRPESPEPVKGEGWDHAVDALRYLVQNLARDGARGACYL